MKSMHEVTRPRRLGAWSIPSLMCVASLVLLASPVLAQEERIETPYRWIEGGTRLGLFAGYIFTSRGNLDIGPGSAPTVGTRFRARLSSPLSFEAGIGVGRSDLWVVDPRLESGPAAVDTVSSDWLILEASLQLALTGARSYRRIQPYVVLGGGILQELSTETATELAAPREPFEYDIGTTPMIFLGVGAEYDVSARFGLGFEVRDNLWRLKTPDGWFLPDVLQNLVDSGATLPEDSQWVHNFELTAALYYYF